MAKNNSMKAGEFRGKVVTSLEYIEKDIVTIKTDLKTRAGKKDITRLQKQISNLQKQISNIKLTSAIVGGVGGVLTAFAAFLGLRKI